MLDRLTASRTEMALVFRPVDVAAQAKRLRLVERGREDGQRNIPDEATDEPSLAEQEVVGGILVEQGRCADEAASHLRAYRDALAQLQTAMDVARIRQSADDALTKFGEIRAHWSGEVAELHRRATATAAELEDFKQAHRLTRSARLPDDRGMSFALLAACVVLESIFNGIFFASGSDLGLLGGVFLALSLSAINVVTGAANGALFLRRAQGSRIIDVVAGSGMFMVIACALVFFNGFVAHYRDLYQLSGDATDVHQVLFKFRYATFDLASIYSWLLLIAGLTFSTFATWKGYHLDDPFPGYGGHERRRLLARQAYLDARRDIIDEAADVRDEFMSDSSNAIEKLKGASSRREGILAARAKLLAEFNSVESNLEQSGQRLLSIYRQENTALRTRPVPRHFDRRFSLPDRAFDRPEFKALLNDQGLEHDADSLLAELDGLRQRVLADHALVLAQAPGVV